MKIKRPKASVRGVLLIAAGMLLLCLNSKTRQVQIIRPEFFDSYSIAHPEPISINTADYWQLRCLPGIDDEKARAILKCRAEIGGFAHCEDLLQAEGITEEILEAVRLQIELDG